MVIVDGDRQYYSILHQEGYPIAGIPVSLVQKPVNASIRLFGFILEEGDPRWQLASVYSDVRREAPFSSINFENALTAVYLSKNTSRRSGYSTTISEKNVRQLSRALHNLHARPLLEDKFRLTQNRFDAPIGTRFEFTLTDRINKGTNEQSITGCPEALYQIRLFDNGRYIGRVGFNIHRENINGIDVNVVSIANVQGIPLGKEINEAFHQRHGIGPFNLLLKRLKYMTVYEKDTPFVLRGLQNPRNTESKTFYNVLFKKEGIPTFAVQLNEDLL